MSNHHRPCRPQHHPKRMNCLRGLRGISLRFAHTGGSKRSTVQGELALWPAPSAQARKPPTVRQRREAGSVGHWLRLRGRSTTSRRRPVGSRLPRPIMSSRRWVWPSSCRANPMRDGRLRTMTNVKPDHAARKRGELSGDGVGRRLSPVIDARRRLHARRRATGGSNASRVGPRDPRYEYLTRSYD